MKGFYKLQVLPGGLDSAYKAEIDRARRENLVGKILARQASIFGKKEKSHLKVIQDRLGWIDVIREMPSEIPRIVSLVDSVKSDGVRHLFVLGMGGSSLAPEVFGRLFGARTWLKSYQVIDTTSPAALQALVKGTDFRKTFFIVSSKSGKTIETTAQLRFFFKIMKELRPLKAGRYFAAITDQGSDLHRIGRRNRFHEIFLNRPDVGGRYSALSFFGLVPGAFTRGDMNDVLAGAEMLLRELEEKSSDNSALDLGVMLGTAALAGKDKLQLIASEKAAPLVPWIEQLVAESTGKDGKGIIPIDPGADLPALPSEDRLYVSLAIKGERPPQLPKSIGGSESTPAHVRIELADPSAIGAVMLLWEMATAVAAAVMQINPFDEPNVSESKQTTATIIQAGRTRRKLPPIEPLIDSGDMSILAAAELAIDFRRGQISGPVVMGALLRGVKPSDYLAILSYTEMDAEIESRIANLRHLIEKGLGITTLRGYGPRFLHSIGQLYKGGPQKGHFLILTREYESDIEIPKMDLTFGKLIGAQAQGDTLALIRRKRPVVVINLKVNPVLALDDLLKLVRESAKEAVLA